MAENDERIIYAFGIIDLMKDYCFQHIKDEEDRNFFIEFANKSADPIKREIVEDIKKISKYIENEDDKKMYMNFVDELKMEEGIEDALETIENWIELYILTLTDKKCREIFDKWKGKIMGVDVVEFDPSLVKVKKIEKSSDGKVRLELCHGENTPLTFMIPIPKNLASIKKINKNEGVMSLLPIPENVTYKSVNTMQKSEKFNPTNIEKLACIGVICENYIKNFEENTKQFK